ncbi:MAG: ATP-dependent Clp protease ATP-binding subunit, partial [bacterium]
ITEMKRIFNPELLNRIDETLIFHSRSIDHILEIIDIQLGEMAKRLADKGLSITVRPEAKRFIADKGFDPVYGARHLKRALQKHMEDPLAEEILRGQFAGDCDITVTVTDDNENLKFEINKAPTPKETPHGNAESAKV